MSLFFPAGNYPRRLQHRGTLPRQPTRALKKDRSLALERLVDQGHYGVKTGRGFFDWSSRDLAELLRERDLRLLQVRSLMKGWE